MKIISTWAEYEPNTVMWISTNCNMPRPQELLPYTILVLSKERLVLLQSCYVKEGEWYMLNGVRIRKPVVARLYLPPQYRFSDVENMEEIRQQLRSIN